MIEVRQTSEFSAWLRHLKDARAKARIVARIERVTFGNLGDHKSLGGGLMEMRVDTGPVIAFICPTRNYRSHSAMWGRQTHAAARHRARLRDRGEITMKTSRFDAAAYLDSAEAQAEYMTAALETGDAEFIRDAVGVVARARGMTRIAKETGLSRESLYKALGKNGNPEFSTIIRIVRALQLTLSARPAAEPKSKKRRAA
jgi:probable addiction module antidote protein